MPAVYLTSLPGVRSCNRKRGCRGVGHFEQQTIIVGFGARRCFGLDRGLSCLPLGGNAFRRRQQDCLRYSAAQMRYTGRGCVG